MTKLVFLDTETTGLGPKAEIWEIGLIVRASHGGGCDCDACLAGAEGTQDTEYCWRIRPRMEHAEPTGLRIGRYYERIGAMAEWQVDRGTRINHPKGSCGVHAEDIAAEVARLLDGATIVGAVPDFDTRHLARFLTRWHQAGTWHYHLVDVETLAAGYLGETPPWNFDDLLNEFGLKYDEAYRHTALGDARMVRDLYDAVYGRHAEDARQAWEDEGRATSEDPDPDYGKDLDDEDDREVVGPF